MIECLCTHLCLPSHPQLSRWSPVGESSINLMICDTIGCTGCRIIWCYTDLNSGQCVNKESLITQLIKFFFSMHRSCTTISPDCNNNIKLKFDWERLVRGQSWEVDAIVYTPHFILWNQNSWAIERRTPH